MKVIPIPAFSDNYIWLIEKERRAIVVDPGEAKPVLDYLSQEDLFLEAILLTHEHEDHIGGVKAIKSVSPNLTIFGPIEVANLATNCVKEGDQFTLFDTTVHVFKTAGHTAEHISYLIEKDLFCGDALFFAGCGRVFTGDYQAQYDALQTFKRLPNDILVFAGHEYTLTNLKFAKSVASNEDKALLEQTIEEVKKLRQQNIPSLPSSIGVEKKINPFIKASSLEEFIKLRQLRDNF